MKKHTRSKQERVSGHKLFLGGLDPKSSSDDLKAYFSKFGEITWLEIIGEKQNNPRGYAFIKFKEKESLVNILAQSHVLEGREIDCRFANSEQKDNGQEHNTTEDDQNRKVYIPQIPLSITKQSLKQHFQKFGEIQDVLIIIRKKSSRAFGYIVFTEKSSAQKVLDHSVQTIGELELVCVEAIAKHSLRDKIKPSKKQNSKSLNTLKNLPVVESGPDLRVINNSNIGKDASSIQALEEKSYFETGSPNHSHTNLRFNKARFVEQRVSIIISANEIPNPHLENHFYMAYPLALTTFGAHIVLVKYNSAIGVGTGVDQTCLPWGKSFSCPIGLC